MISIIALAFLGVVRADWVTPAPLEGVYGEIFIADNTNETTFLLANDALNITEGVQVGVLRNCAVTQATLIPERDGVYQVGYSLSYKDGPNRVFETSIAVNGNAESTCKTQRKIGAAGDIGVVAAVCLIEINAGDAVNLIITPIGHTQPVTIVDGNLNIRRIDVIR